MTSPIQPGSLTQIPLHELLAVDSREHKFLLQIKPELFKSKLPKLSQDQLLRLDRILGSCLKLTAFGKTIHISLRKVLELLPESEIQLVGGGLKYVIGNEGLKQAGIKAIGQHNFGQLFGKNEERLFVLSDIDLRIRSQDTQMEPLTHAENFVKLIGSLFGFEEDLQEQLVEELTSKNSPLRIEKPRFEIEGTAISNYSTLATYKDPELEVDFYFINTLKKAITVGDEDLSLTLGPYLRNRSAKLIPTGEMGNGWWATLSTITKVIIPVKFDLYGLLRSLRREFEGHTLHHSFTDKFSFIVDSYKITKYVERPTLKVAPTRIMFLLNMSCFNLRTEEYNEEFARVINTIETSERCNGLRGRIYQSAREVGWTSIVALLRLILPLEHDLRWKRGHYTCNFNFPKERAIPHVARLKTNQEAVNSLTEILEVPFQNWGPVALFRILDADLREQLYTEIMRNNPSPFVVRQIFTSLISLDLGQAFDFVQMNYEKILGDATETLLLIEQLSECLKMRSKNISSARRIDLFFTVCNKAPCKPEQVNGILNQAARELLATKRIEGCYRLLELILKQTTLVIDTDLWVEALTTFYSSFKDKNLVFGLLKQLLEQQLLNAPGLFQGQEISFIIMAKEMVNQQEPSAEPLLLLLRSGKLNYHQQSEIEKMLESIERSRREHDYASSNISDDFEQLRRGNKAVLVPLLEKIERFGVKNPYFERDIDALYEYIAKTDIKEFQTELFSFIKRCPLSKERVFAFRIAALQHDLTHPGGLQAYQENLARYWDAPEGTKLKDFFHKNHENQTFFISVIEFLLSSEKKKIAAEFLIKYYSTLNEVVLRRFINVLSLQILSSDIEKTSRLMTTVFSEAPQGLLSQFKGTLVQVPITNPKMEAVLRLSPAIWKLSQIELNQFLQGIGSSTDKALRARVWVWYRELHHLTMSKLHHTSEITPVTLKIFEASKHLLTSVGMQEYPIIKGQIEPYVLSHTMIQQIMADRRIPPNIISFFIDDSIHILDSFLRLTPLITESDTASFIRILLLHTLNRALTKEIIDRHESLRLKLAKKILESIFPTDEMSDDIFGRFLAGWLVLQHIVLTTTTIQRNYINLVVDFIKKSHTIPERYYSKIDDDILSFIAKIILKQSSKTHHKLSEEMRKKLALAYLDHPIIKKFSTKMPTTLRVKATVLPLTPEEADIISSPFRSKAKLKIMMDQSKMMTLVSFLAVIIWISLGHIWDHLQIQNKTN